MNVLSKAYVTHAGRIYVAVDAETLNFGVAFTEMEAIEDAKVGKKYANLGQPSWLLPIGTNVASYEEEKAHILTGAVGLLKKVVPQSLQLTKDIFLLTDKNEVCLVAIDSKGLDRPIYITGGSIQNCLFQLIVEHDKSVFQESEPRLHENKRNVWLVKHLFKLPKCRIEEILK